MGIVRNSDSDANDCKITLEDESQEGRWSSKEPIFDKWPKPDTVRYFFYFFFNVICLFILLFRLLLVFL